MSSILKRYFSREENQSRLLFQPAALSKQIEPVRCVSEEKALEAFMAFLETVGPRIVLVGLDEETLGVLLQKLEVRCHDQFWSLVTGFAWWKKLFDDIKAKQRYKNKIKPISSQESFRIPLSLDAFFNQRFPAFPLPAVVTSPVVAHMLRCLNQCMMSNFYQYLSRKCVKEVARDEGLSIKNLLTKIRQEPPCVNPTRMWNREVMDKHPMGVEVFSTFRSPIFVPLVRTEQVKKN